MIGTMQDTSGRDIHPIRLTYMGQEGIEALVAVDEGVVGLNIMAKPPIVIDGYTATKYIFVNGAARVDFLHRKKYRGPTDFCIVKDDNGLRVLDAAPFGSHEVKSEEADEIVRAGYNAIGQVLAQTPAYVPNPIVPTLAAILEQGR